MSQGHIRPQGDGSWEIKFDLGRDPLTGRRVTKYVTFRGTKRKAQEELTRLLGQRNEGSYVEPTKMTVAQYLHHWLEADIERRVAARTAVRHRGIVEKNIITKLGHVPVRKLTAVHIEAFEAELQREGWVKARAKQKVKDGEEAPIQKKRGLSAQTVQHIHRTLSQALSHAVRLGVLFKNPARQLMPPRPPSREIKILNKDEIRTLISAAKGTSLYVPILVAIATGVRRGELLALRWSDIDLKAGALTVNQSLERIKGKVEFKSPKTRTSRRTKACRRLVANTEVTPITLHGLLHAHISHLLMEGVHDGSARSPHDGKLIETEAGVESEIEVRNQLECYGGWLAKQARTTSLLYP